MHFDSDEFRVRVGRLIEELKKRDLDAVILDEGEATSYYFGIDPHQSYYRAGAITSSGEAFFVLRALDKDVCREQTWVTDMVGHPDWEDPLEHIVRKLREYGVANGRIGVDYRSHALTIRTFNVLQMALPEASFVDIDGLPWLLRLRKSTAEVEKMRKASAIGDATFRDLAANICPGMTERDLVRMTVESVSGTVAMPHMRVLWSSVVKTNSIFCMVISMTGSSKPATYSMLRSFPAFRATALG